VHPLRLITAVFCAPVLVAFALAGCGGDGVTVGNTAAETAASTPATSGTPPVTSPGTTPSTGSATLAWVPPTQNNDGSSLTNLAGYIIYYGTDSTALTQTIQVSDASASGYVVSGLTTGTTWYFAVSSYSASGEEGARSPVLRKSI
jgi:hypothetical protein